MKSSSFIHLHCHSHYSSVDAMTPVAQLVAKAEKNGQAGLGLTDHGVLSGNYQLYRECMDRGLLPFPGLEAYLVSDAADKTAKRYHLTLLAYTTEGVKNLNRLSSASHRAFYRKPLLDQQTLANMNKTGIACLTGCYFGWVQQAFVDMGEDDPVGQVKLAERRAKLLARWFYPTYIELQHHGGDDWKRVALMVSVAEKTGLRPIITNDCHYCDKRERDMHSLMKTLVYGGDPGDVTFPGDSYHLATTDWVKMHYSKATWEASEETFAELIDMHAVKLVFLDRYKFHLPPQSHDPQGTLARLGNMAMARRRLTRPYRERMNYELEVIEKTGFADYFLFVQRYCQWARNQGMLIETRGSANASLACWLLGITDLDPIKWKLDFDRFLTPDRERPPDIDLDVEDARRGELIAFIGSLVPLTQIGSYNRLGFDAEGERGSILVTYLAAMRRRHGPEEFKDQFGHVKTMNDLEPDLRAELHELGTHTLFRGIGAHAAGYVLDTPTLPAADWLPTMYIASSKSTVTQMTMDDVEDAGFTKIDMLGAKVLTILHDCLDQLGKPVGDWSWMPLNDSATFTYLRKGYNDNGVFQFGGWTSAKGCREMAVRKIEDLILVNALYRPAARNSGYTRTYLNRKEDGRYPKMHPILAKHLGETLGVPAYQEQVLGVLKDLGMDVAEMNQVLAAVKVKHGKAGYSSKSTATFRKLRKRFNELCSQAGMDFDTTKLAWSLVEGFHAYGFNRAHATAYALRGYRTAYLKVHHPLEFMAATLTAWSGTPQEPVLMRDVRRSGIRILPADVNHSAAGRWAIDVRRNALRRPLTSIKGIGTNAALDLEEKAPFADYSALVGVVDGRKVTGAKKPDAPNGVILKLIQAGAMRSLSGVPVLDA